MPGKPKSTWGGKREGAGSSPLYTSGPMITVAVRMTAEQRDRFKALGGARWLRNHLDTAAKR